MKDNINKRVSSPEIEDRAVIPRTEANMPNLEEKELTSNSSLTSNSILTSNSSVLEQEITQDINENLGDASPVLQSLHRFILQEKTSTLAFYLQDLTKTFYAKKFPNDSEVPLTLSLENNADLKSCIQTRKKSLVDLISQDQDQENLEALQRNAGAFIEMVHSAFSVPGSKEQILERIEAISPILKEVFPGLNDLSLDMRQVFFFKLKGFLSPQEDDEEQETIDRFSSLIQDESISMATRTAAIKLTPNVSLPMNEVLTAVDDWIKIDSGIEKAEGALKNLRGKPGKVPEYIDRWREMSEEIYAMKEKRRTFLGELTRLCNTNETLDQERS